MDYEEKYKEFVEYIDTIAHSALTQDQHELMDSIRQYVYELEKKSEDERIREDLIGYFKDEQFLYHKKEEINTWLEKQGGQKLADKVEPKFKAGDMVKDPYGEIYHIIEVNNDSYKTDIERLNNK